MNEAYREFEFDLPEALLSRLIDVFSALKTAPLTPIGLEGVPEQQGVYQLFLDGELVYIGKTDAEAGLRKRLDRHSRKILHRVGLSSGRVSYKAVRIFVFTALDLEAQLIKHYADTSGTAWNNSGFGANDPGRNRDKTRIAARNFDAKFPIDIDVPLDVDFSGISSGLAALQKLKIELPYTLRFETTAQGRGELHAANLAPIPLRSTARDILTYVVRALPPGWQATRLWSHLLLYRERDEYPDAEILSRSSS